MASKLFKRLGIALTGMALAIGVGVGLSQRGEYKEARAAADTSITGYKQALSVSDVTTAISGNKKFIIVCVDGGTKYLMPNNDVNKPSRTAWSNWTSLTESNFQFTIANNATLGGYTFLSVGISKYFGWSSNANFARLAGNTELNVQNHTGYAWTISTESTNGGTFRISNVKAATTNTPRAIIYRNSDKQGTYNCFGPYAISGIDGSQYFDVELYYEYSAAKSVTISSSSLSGLKTNSDTSISIAVNNFDAATTSVSYSVANVATVTPAISQDKRTVNLTISFDGVGTTVATINVNDGTTNYPATLTINVAAKPKTLTLNNATISDGAIEVKTGGNKQISFTATDTDDQALAVTLADLNAVVADGGESIIHLSGSTNSVINGDAVGSTSITYSFKSTPSVTATLNVSVLNDYLVSVKSVTYNTGLEASQGESPTTSIFATRTGTTYFKSTVDIPLENFLFSYTNSYVSGSPASTFSYDFSHGDTVDATHKSQTIYVFCTLGNASCGSYTITVEQVNNPLTAITLTNVVSHAKDIARNGSFQLEWSYTPENPTDGKGVLFSISNASAGSEISVNNTGLISAGTVPGATARITIKSDHDNTINDYVDVTVVMDEMKYNANLPETQTASATVSIGDRVVFVGVDKSSHKFELTSFAGASTDYGVASSYTTAITKSKIFTVVEGNSVGSVSFKTSDDKYLAWVDSKNSITDSETKDDYGSWVVDGSSIQNVQDDERILYLNYNSGTPRFSCYSDKSGSQYEADYTNPTFIKITGGLTPIDVTTELYNAVCNNFGENKTYAWDATCETFKSSNWNTAGAAITGLSGYANYHLNVAVADAEGNVVQQFLAKYDVVVDKFGTTYDFLNRFTSGGIHYNERTTSGLNSSINNGSNNLTIAIIVIASISTLAIGGYFFIRRRKER